MTYRCLELLDLPAASTSTQASRQAQQAAMRDDDDDDDDDEEEHDEADLDDLRRPSFLLDIGAGSGLSGEILTEEGHQWVGMDVSGGMLEVALEREVEGDLMLADIGQGIPFRPSSFDGAISCVLVSLALPLSPSTTSDPDSPRLHLAASRSSSGSATPTRPPTRPPAASCASSPTCSAPSARARAPSSSSTQRATTRSRSS